MRCFPIAIRDVQTYSNCHSKKLIMETTKFRKQFFRFVDIVQFKRANELPNELFLIKLKNAIKSEKCSCQK